LTNRHDAVITLINWRVGRVLHWVNAKAPRRAHYIRRVLSPIWWRSTLRVLSRLRHIRARRRDVELISSSHLFDRDWYLDRYPDVRAAGIDPALHYLDRGASEGRAASALFDTRWYLAQHPDVAAGGTNPLVHYLRYGACEGRALRDVRRQAERREECEQIASSDLFHREWYLERYPDVRAAGIDPAVHYLECGAREGRNPSERFDTRWYLAHNPDVAAAAANPLLHYLRHGASEGRTATAPKAVPDPVPSDDLQLIASSYLFDGNWYLDHYPDVRATGVDPALHYLAHGASEGRDPSPLFDTAWYLDQYPDVRRSGLNPLIQYLKQGAAEERYPRSPRVNRSTFDLLLASSRRWRAPKSREPGVNFIGPIEFMNGLGASARGFMAGLARADIRLNVIPWRAGFEHLRPHVVDFPSDDLQPINIIHLNLDHLSSSRLLQKLPLAEIVATERYNIAVPSWELTSIPAEWTDLVRCFDEIWCSSSFMAGAMATVSTRTVRVVHPAVEFACTNSSKTRSDFSLPENRFVFFYAADAGSILARKNPRALAEAYSAEFAPDEGACCLVKLVNFDPHHPDIRVIRSIADLRPDVIFMNDLLDESAMRDLYQLIDCYVSPHRSEGLGLTLLEAMNAKKPVIATAYGGVTDFVNPETSYPIDYRLVPVGRGNPPYPEQSLWADPLQSSLRCAMRCVFRNPEEARNVGLRGHAQMHSLFSIDRSAGEIRREVNRIWGL
jgi:glycosyltransferase involved in cell wall biosynthesis